MPATPIVTRRRALSLDAHEALGAQLYQARNALLEAEVDLSNTYGKTSRSTRAAQRALRAVDEVRCALDDQLAVDHPEGFEPSVYYRGTRDHR